MTSLEAASEGLGDSDVLWDDFDRMLDDLPAAIVRVAQHFGFDADAERAAELAEGPLMRRYSKAVEYEYSPALRRELIEEASRRNARDIVGALAMLEHAAQDSPLLARALTRFRGLNVQSPSDPDRSGGRGVPQDRGVRSVRRRTHHQPAQHRQTE
jgi:hypothetical protein